MNRRLALMMLAVIVWIAPIGRAQTAPAGNAHPSTQLVTAEQAAFPFGQPAASTAAPEQKREFARELDLDPLRSLAVQHDGRVKIVDTLARETVRYLTGRHRHTVVVPPGAGGGEPDLFKPDPVFTLLDTVIDPGFYEARPLIGVEYLPLRRAIVAAANPGDELAQRRTLKLGLVPPAAIDAHMDALFNAHADEPVWRSAIRRAENAGELFRFGSSNLLLVAPGSRDQAWGPIGSAPAGSGVQAAAAELGDAWRALDADRANAAIVRLADALPAVHPGVYPGARRGIELAYNRSNAFEWGSWAYLVSLLLLILAFGTGRRGLITAGIAAFVLALALHAFGFGARCFIAERFAIQNQYESMTGISLFAAVVGFALMLARRQLLFGAAAAATGFLVLITATQAAIPGSSIEKEAAILNTSVLLKYHVTTVLTSYGLITLGMIVSVFYLLTHYGARYFGRSGAQLVAAGALGSADNAGAASPTAARTLKDLDTAQMIILQLAFWTLGVGTLLGAWWADHSWGRWWAFDPKETWALVTWIVYLIVIHVRFAGLRDKGLTTAWLSVVGFLVMLWTYFGVNLLLPGLHAYA